MSFFALFLEREEINLIKTVFGLNDIATLFLNI